MALNPQNLVPNSERTPEERRKNAQKAGLASGRRRRQNKNLRDAFLAVQDLLLPKKGGGEETASDAMAFALVRKAVAGDLRAIQLLWECNYGKQTKVDVTSSDGSMSPGNQINLGDRTTEELMQMFKALGSGSGDGQGTSS